MSMYTNYEILQKLSTHCQEIPNPIPCYNNSFPCYQNKIFSLKSLKSSTMLPENCLCPRAHNAGVNIEGAS